MVCVGVLVEINFILQILGKVKFGHMTMTIQMQDYPTSRFFAALICKMAVPQMAQPSIAKVMSGVPKSIQANSFVTRLMAQLIALLKCLLKKSLVSRLVGKI